jgi:hypothetical protein
MPGYGSHGIQGGIVGDAPGLDLREHHVLARALKFVPLGILRGKVQQTEEAGQKDNPDHDSNNATPNLRNESYFSNPGMIFVMEHLCRLLYLVPEFSILQNKRANEGGIR